MTSQLVIFRAFLFIFFCTPDPRSEKKIPVNQLIKKIWPEYSVKWTIPNLFNFAQINSKIDQSLRNQFPKGIIYIQRKHPPPLSQPVNWYRYSNDQY